jgi:tetratricopeptide (TPR) repeat protein
METVFLRHFDAEGRQVDSVNDAGDAPFSDLITRWLDEGERLSEMGEAVPANAGPPTARRLPAAIAAMCSKAERHRALTLVCAVAVSAAAIVVARGFMHRVLASDAPPAELSAPVALAVVAPKPEVDVTPAPVPVAAAMVTSEAEAVPAPASAAAPEPAAPEPETEVESTSVVASAETVAEPDHTKVCRKALRSERTKQALAACRRVAEANPTSADAVVLLAHAELLAGRQEKSLHLARKASALDPGCAEAYLLIGNVQQMAGSKLSARSAYQAYLEHAPSGPHASEVRAILRTL